MFRYFSDTLYIIRRQAASSSLTSAVSATNWTRDVNGYIRFGSIELKNSLFLFKMSVCMSIMSEFTS